MELGSKRRCPYCGYLFYDMDAKKVKCNSCKKDINVKNEKAIYGLTGTGGVGIYGADDTTVEEYEIAIDSPKEEFGENNIDAVDTVEQIDDFELNHSGSPED